MTYQEVESQHRRSLPRQEDSRPHWKIFQDRFDTATVGKLDMRTYSTRQTFLLEQHAEYRNLMELREVDQEILLQRSTTERRSCLEWLNCWGFRSEMLTRQHPGLLKPTAYPRIGKALIDYQRWLAKLSPQDFLPVYMVQIAS